MKERKYKEKEQDLSTEQRKPYILQDSLLARVGVSESMALIFFFVVTENRVGKISKGPQTAVFARSRTYCKIARRNSKRIGKEDAAEKRGQS